MKESYLMEPGCFFYINKTVSYSIIIAGNPDYFTNEILIMMRLLSIINLE